MNEVLLRVLYIVVLFFLLPIATGVLVEKIDVTRKYLMVEKLLYGFVIQLLWSELIGAVCVFFNLQFKVFSYIYLIVSCIIFLIAIVIIVKDKKKVFSIQTWRFGFTPTKLLVFFVIAFQIGWLVSHGTQTISDGTIEQMTVAIQTDTIHQIDHYTGEYYNAQYSIQYFGFYPELLSVWANRMRMSPNVFCNVLLPFIIIPYTYLVYNLWINKLFKDDRKLKEWAMLFCVCLNLYGCYSNYTSSFFMILYPWSINNILINIIIPLYLYNLLNTKINEKRRLIVLFIIASISTLSLSCDMAASIVFITIVWWLVLLCRRYVRIEGSN